MKRIIILLVFVSMVTCLNAQSPQKMSYQAVIRNGSNQLITNSPIGMRFKILRSSASGTEVYIETQSLTSNANGLVTAEIGSGNIVFGDLSSINWADGPYFLKIETDPSGGTNYTLIGTSQILSVPYALYATKAGNGFSGSYNDLSNKPVLFDGFWSNLIGKPNFAAVTTTGNYSDLSNKPVLFSGNYNDLTNKPITDGSESKVTAGTNILVSGSGTTATAYIINLDIPHYIGELYGGGIVFYVDDTGKHGLICGLENFKNNQWSNISSTAIGAAAQSDWDGKGNTTAIINQAGQTNSAAKLCDDYTNINYGTGIYSDWYLPTGLDLLKLYKALYEINKTLETDGNSSTIPIWKNIVFWSSNERDGNNAYYFNFNGGGVGWSGKYNLIPVRPIRAF